MDEQTLLLPTGTAIGAAEIEEWAAGLDDLNQRIASRLYRSEVRERSRRYLASLVGRVGRKDCWQLAEYAKEATPDGMQRLLSLAQWDADQARDDLLDHVLEQIGEEGAVLVLDEAGFLKKRRSRWG